MNSTEATVGQASLAWHGWSLVLELREGGGKDAALQDKPQPASASLLDLRRVCCDFGHHSLHLRVDVTVGD
jgi:hypothetical protein